MNDNHNVQDPNEINIKEYLQVLVRRRKSLLITFLVVFSAVAAYTFLMKPVWEVTARLYLSEYTSKMPPGLDFLAPPANSIDTEIGIIKSRTIAETVVRKFHLNWAVSSRWRKGKVKIAELSSTYSDENPSSDPSFDIVYKGSGNYTMEDNQDGSTYEGTAGTLLKGNNFTLLIADIQGKAGSSFTITQYGIYETVDRVVAKRLDASESQKGNNILLIKYDDVNPVRARNIVKAIVDKYIGMKTDFKSEEARKSVEFISEQIKNVKSDLDEADRQLKEYKSSAGVFTLDSEAQQLIQKVADAKTARAGAALQKKQMEFAIAALKEARRNGRSYKPSVMNNDPVVAGIAAKLTDLELQKGSLLADFTETHPMVRNVNDQINELQRQLLSTFETAADNFAKQEQSYASIITSYNDEIRNLPQKEMELVQLNLGAKANADIYAALLQNYQQARLAQASTVSSVDIIDAPVIPDLPIKPKPLIYLLVGFLGAGMLGVFTAFFREYLDDTIKDPEMAKREFALPLLVAIPYISYNSQNGKGKTLVSYSEPKSPTAEVFRNLRTNIHFTSISRRKQIILITSSFPGEGKTTVMGNFAVSLSQMGSRVLLVDCDLRRSMLHKVFGHNKTPGITDILAGDVEFGEVIHQTEISGIDFVSAGTTPPNPAELLGSEKMQAIFEDARKSYDYILLDAPPMLAVTDAHLLARISDLIIFVLEAGKVSVTVSRRMREILSNVGTPLAGIVINDKNKSRMDFYGYGDRYYGYGYYVYGYGSDNGGNGNNKGWKKVFSAKK